MLHKPKVSMMLFYLQWCAECFCFCRTFGVFTVSKETDIRCSANFQIFCRHYRWIGQNGKVYRKTLFLLAKKTWSPESPSDFPSKPSHRITAIVGLISIHPSTGFLYGLWMFIEVLHPTGFSSFNWLQLASGLAAGEENFINHLCGAQGSGRWTHGLLV